MQHYLPDMYFPGVSCIRVTTPGVCVVTVEHTVVWSATDSSGNTGSCLAACNGNRYDTTESFFRRQTLRLR